MSPAWVTQFKVEFSRDKKQWHSTAPIDGVRDPEMVQRIYLPAPDKAMNQGRPDPYEARYLRFKVSFFTCRKKL